MLESLLHRLWMAMGHDGFQLTDFPKVTGGFPGSPIVPWLLSIRRCLWRCLEDGPNNHRVVKSCWKKCDVRHIFVLALSQSTWYFSCRSSLGMNPVWLQARKVGLRCRLKWFWPMNLLRNTLELNYPKIRSHDWSNCFLKWSALFVGGVWNFVGFLW